MPDAVLLAPLGLALALVVAGAAKLRGPVAAAAAFDDLGVPAALARPVLRRALPWVEVVLGVALVLLPGPVALVALVPALLLTAAYLVLTVRVVRGGRHVECACFGGLGGTTVGRAAVLRNVLLVLAAGLATADAATGHGAWDRLVGLGGDGWAWLTGAAAVALLTGLVLWRTGTPSTPVVRPSAAEDGPDGPARRGIPYLTLSHADGTATSLPELASLRPVLLVRLSTGCASCGPVGEVIGSWPAQAPRLDVRVLSEQPVGDALPDSWPGVVHDPSGRVAAVLGLLRPSAVLLGADALVAAGPVHGPSGVLALFEDVRVALGEDVGGEPGAS